MAATSKVTWQSDHALVVDGVEFIARTAHRFVSESSRFCLVKRPDLVARYLQLLDDLAPARIVELGIYQGGSAALMALVAEPEAMVALDQAPQRVEALDALLAARGMTDRVHLVYGVDQSDPVAVNAALDDAGLQGAVLDLVIDDASHLVDQTRASFNLLFPRLRPGGTYIIEDWSWAHIGFASHLPNAQPLTEVVFELTMALPSHPELISAIEIGRDWAVVTRGTGPIDPAGFSLSSLYNERGRQLLATPPSP